MKKFICLAVIFLSACGTIFSGTTQQINCESNVKGVKIYVDGIEECTAPCAFTVNRSADSVQIIARKNGYKDRVISIRSSVNRTSYFNLIGLYSWSTDALTGSVWHYRNDRLYFDMEKENMTRAEALDYETQRNIRRYVLFTYDNLLEEAYSGNKQDYIAALSELTKIPENQLLQTVMASTDELQLLETLMKN